MKRIILVLLTTFVIITGLTFTCAAVETDVDIIPPEIVTETTIDTEAPEQSVEELKATLYDLYQRLYEYFVEHKTEILGLVGDAIIFVVALLLKSRVSYIKNATKLTNESQGSVVDVVNNMVDGYNSLQQTYEKYGATEDDRNRVVGALVAQNTAILEILTTVYVNSKNLPQGVKDLVNLKYANCLKSLENDEQLKAIVTAVRDNIGTSHALSDGKDNTEV